MRSEQNARHPVQGRPSPEHRGNENDAAPAAAASGSETSASADAAQPELTEREALKLLLKQFQELRDHVSTYTAARTDSIKCSVRNALRRIVLAALGLVAVGALIVMASWLVLSGIAQGAGALFGDQAWIGPLITGVLVLAGVGSGMLYAVSSRKNASWKRTVRKYETRQARQQD